MSWSQRLNKDVAAVSLCAIFLVFCYSLSLKLNLWGDEAFSLEMAKSWESQNGPRESGHLPLYYLLLRAVLHVTGTSNEVLLRIIHAVPFAIGLFLGYRILLALKYRPLISLIILSCSVMIPGYAFYASSIRMYSLLFLLSMWFFYELSRLIAKEGAPSTGELARLLISSILLVNIDFPGLIYYVSGLLVLYRRFYKDKKRSFLYLLIIPPATLAIYGHSIVSSFQRIGSVTGLSLLGYESNPVRELEFLKPLYLALSPVIELSSQWRPGLLWALIFPSLVCILILLSGVLVLRSIKSTLSSFFLLSAAFMWIPFIPLGLGLTRAFLPSQMFMLAVLVQPYVKIPRIFSLINKVSLVVLMVSNTYEITHPSLRLYSSIPFKVISEETSAYALSSGIDRVLISGNSLNAFSIRKYMDESGRGELRISILPVDFDPCTLPSEPFIFLSQMKERSGFIDSQRFDGELGMKVEKVSDYVSLEELPFNRLWKQRMLAGLAQKYAVSVYKVIPLSEEWRKFLCAREGT